MKNNITYRFSPGVSPKKVQAIKTIDKVLHLFFKGRAGQKAINEVTITQFAHIGDLMLMLPALKKLKTVSNYKINLVVNSQNYAIASRLNYVDKVTVADAPWFSRGKKSTYSNFISQLKKINTDLIFDVRGDLRNNLFIKFFTRKAIFAGYNVGGGEALLDEILDFPHTGHTTDLVKPLFDYLKLPDIHFADCWDEEDVPYDIVTDRTFPDDFMVVHLGAGAQSRKWPVDNFIETIKGVSKDIPVYVLGTNQDATPEQLAAISAIPNVVNCVGAYSIPQSIYILKKCSVFLGLESGFSHIAAMLKRKVFCLFSGTSNINVWKPYSFYKDQVTLINRVVPCDMVTGCGKFVCEDNICLKNIHSMEVVGLVKSYLQSRQPSLQNLSA